MRPRAILMTPASSPARSVRFAVGRVQPLSCASTYGTTSRHGRPYALIQPITEHDLELLEWKGLAARRLSEAWKGEEEALYDYL